MLTFYRAAIESVLTFSITVWFGYITVKEKLILNRVVKTASRIIDRDIPSLESLYQERLLGKASPIFHDSSHPANDLCDPFHLAAGLDPSKPGPTGFVAISPLSHTSPVKTEVGFLPSVVFHFPVGFMCIPYHNLLYIILFHILRFYILDHINY